MNINDFISKFALKAKEKIAEYEKLDLNGRTKKDMLDEAMVNWTNKTIDALKINAVYKMALKFLIVKNIPAVTQAVFDLIKARINGITDKAAG